MKYVKLFENWLLEAEGGVKPFDPSKPFETLMVDITAKETSVIFDKDKDLKQAESLMNRFLKSIYKKSDGPELEGETIPLKAIAFKSEFFHRDNTSELSKSKKSYIELTDSNGNAILLMDDSEGSVIGTGWKELGLWEGRTLTISIKDNFNGLVFIITKENDIQTKESKNDNKNIVLNKGDIILALSSMDASEKRPSVLGQDCAVIQFGKVPQTRMSLFTALKYCADDSQKLRSTGIEKPSVLASYLGYTVPDNYTPKQGGIKKADKKA